jgi:hypothetical protein
MVVHFHNPSYMEGKGKMAAVQEWPQAKTKTVSEK